MTLGNLVPVQTLAQYQATISATLFPIHIDLGGREADFRARSAIRQIGCLSLVRVYANAAFECRSVSTPRPGVGHYVLQLQESGNTAYDHLGRSSVCGLGRLMLIDARSRIIGEQFGEAQALMIRLPLPLLKSLTPNVERYCGSSISAETGSARILAGMVRDYWSSSAALTEHDHQILPGSMLRMVEAAFRGAAVDAPGSSSQKDRRLARLQQTVIDHAHDPGLSADRLASLLGMSRSALYALSRQAGNSIEAMIIDARLLQVEAKLIDPAYAAVSLTELAFQQGFHDFSHFSRRFKQRYGMSPVRYRADKLGRGERTH